MRLVLASMSDEWMLVVLVATFLWLLKGSVFRSAERQKFTRVPNWCLARRANPAEIGSNAGYAGRGVVS